jgi:predicted transcriptional regulator
MRPDCCAGPTPVKFYTKNFSCIARHLSYDIAMDEAARPRTRWTFLTNHARVLAAIARDPAIRVRDIAAQCILTERAVQKIISDLEADGYLNHTRRGRTNVYNIPADTPLRHPADQGPSVAALLSLFSLDSPPGDDGQGDGGGGR